MIYEIEIEEAPDNIIYENLEYIGVLNIVIKHLLSDKRSPLVIRRRCCSSVSEMVLSNDAADALRGLVSNYGDDIDEKIRKLDIAVNNWYIRGVISATKDETLGPKENNCEMDGR